MSRDSIAVSCIIRDLHQIEFGGSTSGPFKLNRSQIGLMFGGRVTSNRIGTLCADLEEIGYRMVWDIEEEFFWVAPHTLFDQWRTVPDIKVQAAIKVADQASETKVVDGGFSSGR